MTMERDRVPLDVLDPETRDPGYWARLQRRIMASAAMELARRRREAELTVSGVLASWSRAVLPGALLAAALATLLLMREAPRSGAEIVSGSGSVPAAEAPDAPGGLLDDASPEGGVSFASLENF